MEDDKTVRIAVIGDSGVGKTSLITAAATETFPDDPPPVLPPARLPADTTPEGVPVVITDTSSKAEDKQALGITCQEADVIVLCFSMDKPQTLRRVSTYWMPELRRLGVHVPVMLVGCKNDIRPADQSLHQAVLPVVKTFPQIETCMECSSKKLQFVGEVFYYALKAVVHPMAPLYEPEAQQLKPLCARALKRIFMLCDKDGDGILNDGELNAFQVHCFNAPLQPEELVGVKQVVADKIPQGIVRNGLSLPGFLFLHALFIERGRLETTWAVVRRFGYDNDLRLAPQVLDRPCIARAPDQVVELTDAGRKFFTDVFKRFDVDNDDVLSTKEREEMFSTAPEDPWAKVPEYEHILVETSRKGGITLSGFLAMWAYTAAHNPTAALAGALYLGHPDSSTIDRLFQVAKVRRGDTRRADGLPKRSVVQCLVFGAGDTDVQPVLEGLIAQARPTHAAVTGPIETAVAAVVMPVSSSHSKGTAGGNSNSSTSNSTRDGPGENSVGSPHAAESGMDTSGSDHAAMTATSTSTSSTTTLVLHSVTDQQILADPGQLQQCDVAAFVFDGSKPELFKLAVQQMVAVASAAGDTLPCLFVALNDASMSADLVAEIGEACILLEVKPPVQLGSLGRAAAYQAIVQTAFQPELAIPYTPTLKATRQYRRMLRRAALFTGAGTVAVLAGYFAYRLYKGGQEEQQQQQKTQGSGSVGMARKLN